MMWVKLLCKRFLNHTYEHGNIFSNVVTTTTFNKLWFRRVQLGLNSAHAICQLSVFLSVQGKGEGGTPVSGPRSFSGDGVEGGTLSWSWHSQDQDVGYPLPQPGPGEGVYLLPQDQDRGYPTARTRTRGTPLTAHAMVRICSGRHVSCGHTGGLSCLLRFQNSKQIYLRPFCIPI